MPFRRNIERDNILLGHWQRGDTVKIASLFTGIPEGTVSHYYSKFNRNKQAYIKLSESGRQEPPRSSPIDAAAAALFLTTATKTVANFLKVGEYAKARDYLQVILLLMDLNMRLAPIMQNVDPKKMKEIFQNMISIVKLSG